MRLELAAYHGDLLTLGWPQWAADLEVEMLGSWFTQVEAL